jgi:FkbM family methyltransferase
MKSLHRWLRKLIHRPFLAIGFRLVRAPRFERVLRAWELEHDDFYFLQVGAHNGVTSDPFHRFVVEGWWWNVALVEPQSRSCEVLREIYRDRIHLKIFETAVGTDNGTLSLFKINEQMEGIPYWASQLASTRREVIASHTDRIKELDQWIIEEKVTCRTLASIFAETKYPRLDCLAIDVEGFDFEVVKQIDQLPQLPKMIYFEHRHLSESDYRESLRFLKERGYRTETPEQGDTFAWR